MTILHSLWALDQRRVVKLTKRDDETAHQFQLRRFKSWGVRGLRGAIWKASCAAAANRHRLRMLPLRRPVCTVGEAQKIVTSSDPGTYKTASIPLRQAIETFQRTGRAQISVDLVRGLAAKLIPVELQGLRQELEVNALMHPGSYTQGHDYLALLFRFYASWDDVRRMKEVGIWALWPSFAKGILLLNRKAIDTCSNCLRAITQDHLPTTFRDMKENDVSYDAVLVMWIRFFIDCGLVGSTMFMDVVMLYGEVGFLYHWLAMASYIQRRLDQQDRVLDLQEKVHRLPNARNREGLRMDPMILNTARHYIAKSEDLTEVFQILETWIARLPPKTVRATYINPHISDTRIG